MLRLRGYFRPTALAAGVAVDDGAFEIILSPNYNPIHPTVILITNSSTNSGSVSLPYHGRGGDEDRGRFAYMGWASHSGLPYVGYTESNKYPATSIYSAPPTNQAWAAAFLLALHQQAFSGQYNLICARAAPRMIGRPQVHILQRDVELVRTVQRILKQPTNSPWHPGSVGGPQPWPQFAESQNAVVVAEGGSFGGYTSVCCATLFPNDFHGAFSTAAPISVRRYVGEQESWYHQMALCGFNTRSGKDFNRLDTLHYGRAMWQYEELMGPWTNWSPFFHTSVPRLWRDNKLPRPVYFVLQDEDSVGTGTDSIPLFTGQRTYSSHNSATNSSGVTVYWSVTEKHCHDGGPHRTAISGTLVQGWDADLFEFIPVVIAAYGGGASYSAPSPANDTEEPYSKQSLHIDPYPSTPPTSSNPKLWLDRTFGANSMQALPAAAKRDGKLWGSGTYLGGTDSLLIDERRIYVGSAEGVVTWFQLDTTTRELVPQAMSPALGYGAWGMAIGQVIPDYRKEIVVSTWRGLFILDPDDLSIRRSKTDLPFEQARPRHLRIVSLTNSVISQTTMGFLAVSDLGAITLYDGNLNEVVSYGEPGIVDMELVGTSEMSVELALLSERGHVIKTSWDTNANTMQVLAVSERVNGDPRDLELGKWNNDPAVFALYSATPEDPLSPQTSWPSTVRVFRTADLSAPPSIPRTTVGNSPGLYGKEMDLELIKNSSGAVTHYVVMNGGKLYLVNAATGATIGDQSLPQFAPMACPRDVVIGDLGSMEDSQNFAGLDFVLSTEPGYVAWQTVDWLNGTGTSISPNTDRGTGTFNAPPQWCNRTTSATWGMCVDQAGTGLELIDQSGSRWHVAGKAAPGVVPGDTKFLYQVMFAPGCDPSGGTPSFSALQTGPFRAMCYGGSPASMPVPASTVSLVDRTTAPGFQLPGTPAPKVLDIRTNPYVPQNEPRYLGQATLWTNGGLITTPTTIVTGVHVQYAYDGYWPFPMGGEVWPVGDPGVPNSTTQAHWFSGQAEWDRTYLSWGNLVQGVYHDGSQIQQWAASTSGPSATPGLTGQSGITGHELRSAPMGYAMHDCQTLRLLRNPLNLGKVIVALGTPGGRVILLSPPTQANGYHSFQLDSADYGYGGMALATHNALENERADLYFGVVSHFADHRFHAGTSTNAADNEMVGALVALHWDGNPSFNSTPQVKVLNSGTLETAYGVAGIAVGELIPGNNKLEIVVGTLDGHLLVYERDSSTGDFGTLLYSTLLEGAVGAFNSIVIADLNQDQQNELYVAGSFGLRKFIYSLTQP